METRFKLLKAFATEKLAGEVFANIGHALRVTQLALDLGAELKCDREIVIAAGLLHDIGVALDKGNHYTAALIPAREMLIKIDFPAPKIAAVLHAIEAHSRYGGPEPQTNEAKAIYDADCIDFIGAIGLARGFYRTFVSGKEVTGSSDEIKNIVRNLHDTVKAEPMFTEMGRSIRQERLVYLTNYLETLEHETKIRLDF